MSPRNLHGPRNLGPSIPAAHFKFNARPPGWTFGPILACVICGKGVVTRNPQGEPMHVWCLEKQEGK